jgi:hypothetical protein
VERLAGSRVRAPGRVARLPLCFPWPHREKNEMIRKQSSEVLAAQSCKLRRLLSPPSFLGRQREDRLMQWIFGLAPNKKNGKIGSMFNGSHLLRKSILFRFGQIADGINLATLFPQDLLQEKDNVQLRVVNYILYGTFIGISQTSIQLVRTCLVLNWDQEQKGSDEEVHTSFVEVRTNDLIRDFIRIELVHFLYRKKEG